MVDFSPDLPSVVPSSGKAGDRHADDRNAIIAALEALNGAGATPVIDIISPDGQEGVLRIRDDADHARWQIGRDPDGHFTLRRYDVNGDYVSTPLFVVWDTGFIYSGEMQVDSSDSLICPLVVKHASTTPGAAYFIVADSDGNGKFQVLWDGTLRSNWGSSGYAMTQIGCVQVVRDGATGSQTMIGAYTSVADANADSPVFEVHADGSVWSDYVLGSGDGGKYLTPKAYVDGIKTSLKAAVAASTDFADFQSRIASW